MIIGLILYFIIVIVIYLWHPIPKCSEHFFLSVPMLVMLLLLLLLEDQHALVSNAILHFFARLLLLFLVARYYYIIWLNRIFGFS